MSFPFLAKTAISCGVPALLKHAPDAIKALWCRFFALEVTKEKIAPHFMKPNSFSGVTRQPAAPPLKRKQRKPRDTTKLTKHHWDYIMAMYEAWQADCSNPDTISKKQYEVVERLNLRMGLNKSRTFYASIFNRTLLRSECSDDPLNFDNTLF